MYDEIEEKTVILPPFKHFVMSVGEIPSSYLETMTYYEMLVWFTNYLGKTVIPAVNENGEAVTELQDLFVKLQTYVNNYFDNLDVQEEIDHKLDEMVTDGTMQTIVNTYCEPILSDLTEQINDTKDLVDLTVSRIETPIQQLRKDYYNQYHELEIPGTPNLPSFFDIITIYESNDKENYKYGLDLESLKNTSTNTYYVDNNGTSGGEGTEAAPYHRIYDALNAASAGDTIILKKGIYRRQNFGFDNVRFVEKDINIIGEDGVILTSSDSLSWSTDSTYTNVYKATRTGVSNVIDFRGKDEKVFSKFTLASSLADCSTTLNSYYVEGTTVYVNNGEEVTNDNVCVGLQIGWPQLPIHPSENNCNVYLENLICIAGAQNVVGMYNSLSAKPTITAVNCKFLYNETDNAVNVLGCDTIFIGCEASYARYDGFNYHHSNNMKCYSIEIDCIAGNDGRQTTTLNNNGSTTHDGNKIIRINGVYFNSRGGCIADVNNDTVSININCKAFDSLAGTNNAYDTDFCCQQAGVTMYLYNCYSKGSKSWRNLCCIEDTTMYISNCKYDTITGNGNIIYLDE